jgi:hypothetical protein
MKSLFKFLATAGIALCCSSCGMMESQRTYRQLTFSLPNSWDEIDIGKSEVYTATDSLGDGFDLLVIVGVPHKGDIASISNAEFEKMSERIAGKSVTHARQKAGIRNYTLLEKRFEEREGLPYLFMRTSYQVSNAEPPGGKLVLSMCMVAAPHIIYTFSLRQSEASYESNPGRFENMVSKLKLSD